MKSLACIVLAVLLVVASAVEDAPKDKRSVIGYSGIPAAGYAGWGYPGLGYGYSGLGYGYSGLGYGYSGLGYGYNYPWGYSGYHL